MNITIFKDKQRRKHFFIVLGLNVAVMIALFSFYGIHYELSDDWFFSVNIAEGHYDYTFCSYFIQVISGLLQKIIYPVNAFMLLQLIFCFISMITIGYFLIEKQGIYKGTLVIMVIESAFALNAYTDITFTKTAAIMLVAGSVVLFRYHKEKGAWKACLYGAGLVIIGSFYRFQIFYSVLAMTGAFIAAHILTKTDRKNMKSLFQAIKQTLPLRTVLMIALILISAFSLNKISRSIIYSQEGLEHYREFNSLRSSVVDYDMPDYNEGDAADKFLEIGISENDYNMMVNWYVDEQGAANIETLREIVKIQDEEVREQRNLITKITNMLATEFWYVTTFLPEGILVIAGLCIGLLYLLVFKGKSWIYFLAMFAMGGALYTYLYIVGRSNYRAVFSIWFALAVYLMWSTQYLEIREWVKKLANRNTQRSVGTKVLLCTYVLCYFMIIIANSTVWYISQAGDGYNEFEEYILEADDDQIFMMGRYHYLRFRNSCLLEQPLLLQNNEAFDKCVYFGNPYLAHPRYYELLEKHGISNPYTDMIDNPNIYLVDYQDIDMILCYLNEQYGGDSLYTAELVEEIESVKLYRIITAE